jgi:hypothetical protein
MHSLQQGRQLILNKGKCVGEGTATDSNVACGATLVVGHPLWGHEAECPCDHLLMFRAGTSLVQSVGAGRQNVGSRRGLSRTSCSVQV